MRRAKVIAAGVVLILARNGDVTLLPGRLMNTEGFR